MEITGYIAALLFTEEVVVLPGFGAFKVNYKSSVVKDISDEMAAILPPVKEVSFSSEMKEGAGL
ncbi:MAG TPA: SPOR domain-containing protein, partial [Bacteroidales bacterium]|nr:SPOR domain-containing protein [Bacteroidales bacterium]